MFPAKPKLLNVDTGVAHRVGEQHLLRSIQDANGTPAGPLIHHRNRKATPCHPSLLVEALKADKLDELNNVSPNYCYP